VATSREIAQLAGVSQATVSRVLHGSTSVTADTRDRVLAVLAETGYQPNMAARAMRTQRTGTIGVILASLANPFYPEILRAIGQSLAARGRRMIVWDSEGPGDQGAIEAVEQRLVDGLVFTTATIDSTALRAAIDRRTPVVLVNRTVREFACDQIESNNYSAAMAVASYFAGHGHRRAGLVTADTQASTARDRAAGFLAGAAAAGLKVDRRHVRSGSFSHAGGATAVEMIMTSPRPPSALFCVNDLSALGAIDGAKSLGLRVPDDLWVVGYDDIDLASWTSYGLTTVHQPLTEMTEAAVELLLGRIDDPARPFTHKQFESKLMIRTSTAGAEIKPTPTPRQLPRRQTGASLERKSQCLLQRRSP
jgi:LacI family transcriptional regulator